MIPSVLHRRAIGSFDPQILGLTPICCSASLLALSHSTLDTHAHSPGTGKTLMARAIASSSNATFINLKASTIHNKWFGESQKLVSAVFSLAHKLAPCIIFADEADSLLVKRGGGGGEGGPSAHEVSTSMMAQFLTLIDGLCDADSSEVLFLCATNRPFDMDEAILRRLSKQILFGLPDETERLAILKVTLASTKLEPNVSLALLARRLDQYSGSDIKELCKGEFDSLARSGLDCFARKLATRSLHKSLTRCVNCAFCFEICLPLLPRSRRNDSRCRSTQIEETRTATETKTTERTSRQIESHLASLDLASTIALSIASILNLQFIDCFEFLIASHRSG